MSLLENFLKNLEPLTLPLKQDYYIHQETGKYACKYIIRPIYVGKDQIQSNPTLHSELGLRLANTGGWNPGIMDFICWTGDWKHPYAPIRCEIYEYPVLEN